MNKEQFAELLNGRQYRNEISKDEERIAKENGLVVVFGASDDLIEFRGAMHDEQDCYEGDIITFTKDFKFPTEEEYAVLKRYNADIKTYDIEAVWDKDGYSWQYETDIPHATFEIVEDDEKYCKGIVFSINDLK